MALTSTKRGARSAARAPRGTTAGKRVETKAPEPVPSPLPEAAPEPLEEQVPGAATGAGQDAGPTSSKARTGKCAASKPGTKVGTKPKVLVQRIYDTIDGELTKLEEQAGTSSQDRERASRALAQMVNSLEKAVDMQRDIAKSGKRASSKDKEALAHAEQLREEIAQRLERLNRKRASGT